MDLRSRIDADSLVPLESQLRRFPGGVARVHGVAECRRVEEALAAEAAAASPRPRAVTRQDLRLPSDSHGHQTPVRIYRPESASTAVSAGIYFIHGGGMILGSLETEDESAAMLCEELGAVVVSVGYRLAPEHPYPVPVNDCWEGLRWFCSHAPELGVDRERVAIFGASAGGGLALACALRGREAAEVKIRCVMAAYPMIDDRCDTPAHQEVLDVGVWDRDVNLEAWALYLDGSPADLYAAPARAEDLSGLPPVFIDVGDVDLFRDDDVQFAARLLRTGVPTELHVYPGAYHASELVAPEAALSVRIWTARIESLRAALAA